MAFIEGRPPVVAYGNGRLVLMYQHDDCVELRSRYTREGVVQQVVALLYREGDAIFMLCTVSDEGGGRAEAWDAMAYMDEKEATRDAIHTAMYATRTGSA